MRSSAAARRPVRLLSLLAGFALVAGACGGDGAAGVEAAQARVDSAEEDVQAAKDNLKSTSDAFCGQAEDYVQAIDRYGRIFTDAAVTVGDVQTLGADLAEPQAETKAAAQAVLDAHDQLTVARQELAEAEADLAEAEAEARGTPTTIAPEDTEASKPKVPTASVDAVKEAEDGLADASEGISATTPLREAAESFNAAAHALEMAWLNLIADAGCLSEDQAADAHAAVREYTVALQTSLQAAGYYDGAIDGVYGPKTVAAVEALQEDAGLPVTGTVDRATSLALDAAVVAKEGQDAAELALQTVAVQTALKVTGFWDGPVDGEWTDELTEALMDFQEALGVEPTGEVDAETLAAFEEFLEEGPPTPTTEPPDSPEPPETTEPVESETETD